MKVFSDAVAYSLNELPRIAGSLGSRVIEA
jgi:hypothetical protein